MTSAGRRLRSFIAWISICWTRLDIALHGWTGGVLLIRNTCCIAWALMVFSEDETFMDIVPIARNEIWFG